MRKLTMLGCCILLCVKAISQAPKEKSLLWQISGKGLAQPSYLYGTIHLICPQDIAISPVLKSKFNLTKQLYLELDLDDPNMMTQMVVMMEMKDTSTIEGLLGKAAFDSVSSIFKSKAGVPLEMMNKAKPILLMSLIYPSLLGCQPDSWEQTFQKMAVERKMELKGLEELSGQAKVLEQIPYKIQADMLRKTLLDLDSTKKQFIRMIDTYKSKDIDGMYALTTADDDFGKYEGILLKDRNNNWIPIIAAEAKKMPTFFAVGAGHLGGATGVINLLREKGFIVSPVIY
jgi:uncharacterized protein YbaP (TraB family)